MNRALAKQTILYGFLAAFLFGAFFLATFRDSTKGLASEQVDIVTFGDSVFGEIRDETAVPALLEVALEKSVFNGAMGGTGIARTEADRRLDYTRGSLSLVGLTKSIYARDFGVQQSGEYRESMMEYFPEVIDGLEAIDFTQVETIVIQHGINDYHAGTPIDNPEDPYDEYSFLGALRGSIKMLRKVNPDVRILLVTPTYTWYIYEELTCEEMDYGGGVLEEYVNAELALGAELGVEVLDLYHDYLPHEKPEDYALYTRDGVHPTEEGRRMMAEKIAEVLAR